ncbi:MAG: YbeD family protein [Gammaproteobacteria bacterium]
MSTDELLDFPCIISVKAMGKCDVGLEAVVLEIISRHVERIEEDAVKTTPSRNGNYLSVSVSIQAHSRQQMDALYQDLVDCEQVIMAL